MFDFRSLASLSLLSSGFTQDVQGRGQCCCGEGYPSSVRTFESATSSSSNNSGAGIDRRMDGQSLPVELAPNLWPAFKHILIIPAGVGTVANDPRRGSSSTRRVFRTTSKMTKVLCVQGAPYCGGNAGDATPTALFSCSAFRFRFFPCQEEKHCFDSTL